MLTIRRERVIIKKRPCERTAKLRIQYMISDQCFGYINAYPGITTV